MQLTTSWQTISSATLINSNVITLQGRYTAQSVTGNYTDTEFRIINYANSGDGWRTTSGTVNFTGAYTDSGSCATYPNYVNNGYVLLSIAKRIYHNTDGSKSITLGGHVDAILGGTKYNANPAQTSVVLPKINRISTVTLSPSTFNIGDTIKATITQYVSTYHQTLYIVINNTEILIQSNVTGTIDIETSSLANSIYQQIPNAKYYDSEFRLKTYDSSNNYVGIDRKTFRANVVNSEPLFDVAYQDTNASTLAITNDNQEIIQNNSTLQINITDATAQHYSTLSSFEVVINGVSTTGSISTATKDIDIGTLDLSSNTTASVKIIDSRGFYTTKTLNLTILEWKLPTAIITLGRKQNYYTATDITADATYSSLDGNNSLTIQYRIKKTTEANYGAYASLTDNVTTTFNADNLYAWDVQVLLTDLIGSTTYNLSLGIGLPIFFIDRQLRSIGVNCFPVGTNTAEVNGVDITNTYSESEMPIGTWIDGKTIYRKVFPFTTPSTETDYQINTGLNMDTIINTYGGIYSQGNFNQIPYVIWFGTSYYYMSFRVSNNIVYYRGSAGFGNASAFAVIEYTKV